MLRRSHTPCTYNVHYAEQRDCRQEINKRASKGSVVFGKKKKKKMADNNNEEAAAEEAELTVVETKIERLKSDNPKQCLFSVTFDKFEDLSSEKGHCMLSSKFSCFGNQWRLQLCPGGNNESPDGMVAVYLERCSGGRNLAIKYSIAITDRDYQISRQFKEMFDTGDDDWGWDEFCSRSEITGGEDEMGYLVKGALIIHVSMQLDDFIPKNPALSIMLKMFDDESSADVAFEICEQQKSDNRKSAKTSAENILYHAHRCILQHYSPELSALCATSDDGMTPITITDVKAEVFRRLLYYVYGGEISSEEFVGNEKDFINAADKYGVTNLKLEAEVWYVNNTEITIENVIDNLLYADAMNCALLKESVMDFIVENKEPVIQRVSFRDVPGDACKDLLVAVARHEETDSSTNDDDDDDGDDEIDAEKTYSKMRIRDLREKLHYKGLDIDGSRESLIASLKEHSS